MGREPATGIYRLDIFREPHDGDIWICRREDSIRLPYDRIILTSIEGVPYLVPEVVLLFKAAHRRPGVATTAVREAGSGETQTLNGGRVRMSPLADPLAPVIGSVGFGVS